MKSRVEDLQLRRQRRLPTWLLVLALSNLAVFDIFLDTGCGASVIDVTLSPGRVDFGARQISEQITASIGRPANWSIDPEETAWFTVEKISPTENVDSIQIQVTGGGLEDFPVEPSQSIRITAVPVEAQEPSGNPVSGHLSVRGVEPFINRVGPRLLLQEVSSPDHRAVYRIENPGDIEFEMTAAVGPEGSDLLTIKDSLQFENSLAFTLEISAEFEEEDCSIISPDYSFELFRCQRFALVCIEATSEEFSTIIGDPVIVVY